MLVRSIREISNIGYLEIGSMIELTISLVAFILVFFFLLPLLFFSVYFHVIADKSDKRILWDHKGDAQSPFNIN
jgi:hypothetical protein